MAAPNETPPPVQTVATLAEMCGGQLAPTIGLGAARVAGVAAVDEAGPDEITWVTEAHHVRHLASCRAAAVIGTAQLLREHPRGISVQDPDWAMAQILACFLEAAHCPPPGVHPSAVIESGVKIGQGVAIGAYAVVNTGASIGARTVVHEGVSIGRGAQVGQDCVLYDRCVVYDRCRLGDRVVVHAGAVIGADGFGFLFRKGSHHRIPQTGTVVIEDDVEIGANSCIDRAKFGATRIGRGSKIDNLVMVAHNVQVGPLCIITAQCGIAGSARLGTGVIMGGQSGVTHGVRVGDAVRIAAKTAVEGSLPAQGTVSGVPAQDHRTELKDKARVRRLPKLFEQVAELSQRVTKLEAATHDPSNGRT